MSIIDYNYFEVLELSIDDFQDKDEATIKKLVNDAHTKLYALTIGAYANVPRPDGLTQAQWQKVLNDAKETLLDPRKRQKHIADLMPEPESTQAPEATERPEPESTQAPEHTERPEPESTQTPERKSKWWVLIAVYTGQLFIAICTWKWIYDAIEPGGGQVGFGQLITLFLEYCIPFYFFGFPLLLFLGFLIFSVIEIEKLELLLGGIVILVIPVIAIVENVMFESRSLYFSLFLHPLSIILTFLFRTGFIEYCYIITLDFLGDYFTNAIRFLKDCGSFGRYRSLIAIFAGTLVGGLVTSGIGTELIIRTFLKLGFVSSDTSITSLLFDSLFDFDFLAHCLCSLWVITTFVGSVAYKRLGLMIKRLILILSVILAPYLTITIDDVFRLNVFNGDLFFLPAALLAIFYYIVGYVRHTRSRSILSL
ncbi:hypothetical protein C6499_10490 [Candidatus Poribacteria bacterium]|nr:MAG: hypothetical protein C6499_10490 [Candidatus Poribacteria bacterium]